jgi:hypothetical protein
MIYYIAYNKIYIERERERERERAFVVFGSLSGLGVIPLNIFGLCSGI